MAGASSWSFTEADAADIAGVLERFLSESSAKCVLLIDRAGQLVATAGEPIEFDPTAFATLTAADFSANDQLARLVGEREFSTLVHQGEKESMVLADVARRVIVVALFDQRTTLGLVRLKLKDSVGDLTRLFDQIFSRSAASGTALGYLLGDAAERVLGDLRDYEGDILIAIAVLGFAYWLWSRRRAKASASTSR